MGGSFLSSFPEPLYVQPEFTQELREKREQIVQLLTGKKVLEGKLDAGANEEAAQELQGVEAALGVCQSLLSMREEEIGRLSFESRVIQFAPQKRPPRSLSCALGIESGC